ncbi:MAG TPA: IS5 family transposase [Ktedonobacterales bacterium]|nr:IS5 family transposase [Ktedonobacterales bacterium]
MNTTYPSDLSDAEWGSLQRFLPSRSPHGELRRHSLRSVFDAHFYLLRTGCPWRYLPSNFPPWQTVYYHFRQFCRTGLWTHLWRALHEAERRRVGKDPHPGAAIMGSQSAKTVEESARIRGFDAHTCVKGRKRHLLVDTLGLPISVYVTPADMHDTQGARRLLAGLKCFVPRRKKICANAAYRGQELVEWCTAQGDWDLDVAEHMPGVRGFSVLPKGWVVERTFGWLSRNRLMSKDYERKVQTSETLIEVAMIRLLVARHGRRN